MPIIYPIIIIKRLAEGEGALGDAYSLDGFIGAHLSS